jgi:hypothetical protein
MSVGRFWRQFPRGRSKEINCRIGLDRGLRVGDVVIGDGFTYESRFFGCRSRPIIYPALLLSFLIDPSAILVS